MLRDVLLTIAEAGICQIRWSHDVLDEMERNLSERANAPSAKQAVDGAQYVRQLMEDAFPDAMVPPRAYRTLVSAMTNDEKDRHVLAAAIACRADVLVTANTRDFPASACDPFGIDVQDPDTFLVHQFELAPERFLETLEVLASERHDPMASVDGILQTLAGVTPRFREQALRAWNRKRL